MKPSSLWQPRMLRESCATAAPAATVTPAGGGGGGPAAAQLCAAARASRGGRRTASAPSEQGLLRVRASDSTAPACAADCETSVQALALSRPGVSSQVASPGEGAAAGPTAGAVASPPGSGASRREGKLELSSETAPGVLSPFAGARTTQRKSPLPSSASALQTYSQWRSETVGEIPSGEKVSVEPSGGYAAAPAAALAAAKDRTDRRIFKGQFPQAAAQ